MLADHFDGRIIFMSTCSVYGAQDAVLDETSPTNPLSVYASTKLAAEQHLAGQERTRSSASGTLFGVSDQFARIRLDLVANTLVLKAATLGSHRLRRRPVPSSAARQGRGPGHRPERDHGPHGHLQPAPPERAHRGSGLPGAEPFPRYADRADAHHFQDARNYRVQSEQAIKVLGFSPVVSDDDGIEEVSGRSSEGASGISTIPATATSLSLSKSPLTFSTRGSEP